MLKNNIDFNAVKGKTKIPDQKWKDLLDHFNLPRFVLINDNFEFPDLLGAAAKQAVADMVVCADEPGRHHLAAAVDHPVGGRVVPDHLVAGADGNDAACLDIDGAGIENAKVIVDRKDGCVANQKAHGIGRLRG